MYYTLGSASRTFPGSFNPSFENRFFASSEICEVYHSVELFVSISPAVISSSVRDIENQVFPVFSSAYRTSTIAIQQMRMCERILSSSLWYTGRISRTFFMSRNTRSISNSCLYPMATSAASRFMLEVLTRNFPSRSSSDAILACKRKLVTN